MCDDVPAFADASVTLVIGIVKKFFMMIGFSGGPSLPCLMVKASCSWSAYCMACPIHMNQLPSSVTYQTSVIGVPCSVMLAGVLWTVAPSLVLFLLVYAAVGTVLTTTVFGKRLMQLQFLQLQKEGDLRFDLVRTRENSGESLLKLNSPVEGVPCPGFHSSPSIN